MLCHLNTILLQDYCFDVCWLLFKHLLLFTRECWKKTIIQNWFTPHMCRKTYWIRSLLLIVTCECATARVGGARPSTIDAWQCFLLDIRDCIKEWLFCFCCPSLSPSLLFGPWYVEYVSVVLFCYILDAMLCCVKKLNKKMLITKKKHLLLLSLLLVFVVMSRVHLFIFVYRHHSWDSCQVLRFMYKLQKLSQISLLY